MSGHRDDDEEPIARLSPHGRAVVAPVVAFLIVIAVEVYLWGALPERWMSDVAALVGALVVVVGVVPPVARWAATSYLLTTQRIVVRHGVLARHRTELLLSRVGEVTVRRRGLQALAGSGDVLVAGPAEEPLVLADVPRPRLVVAALQELMADQDESLRQNGRP